MVAHVNTVAFLGIEVLDVDVQVQISSGLPAFAIVGLPDKAVTESRERVRAALTALGLALPPKRITVNLAPADVLKEGCHFDLLIALALLAAMEVLPGDEIADYIAVGELALDGVLAPVAGALPAAIHANARNLGLICPEQQGSEAAWAGQIAILASLSLLSLINHFKGSQVLSPPRPALAEEAELMADMVDIKGQETAKRALEIVAAGGRKIHAGGASAGVVAGARRRRDPGSEHDTEPGRDFAQRWTGAAAAVSRSPSFGFHGGAGRRRPASPARRGLLGPSRRPVLR